MLPSMKLYSIDLRERVLAAVDAGMSHRRIAVTFKVNRTGKSGGTGVSRVSAHLAGLAEH